MEATPATATGPTCGAAPGPEARFCAEIVLSPAGGRRAHGTVDVMPRRAARS